MAAPTTSAATASATCTSAIRNEFIFSYPDGSVYMGDMINDKKHGRGTLRTAAFIYGAMYHPDLSADTAEDNSHLAKWHEYIGEWSDDVMHGHGKHVMMSGDGKQNVLFDGVWANGIQKATKDQLLEYFAD
jgi:hypothetical protein